ncbi:hypothetical protein HETIRDRAFT_482121 [Heterobasidion irregulare TC 32-1]|uniref:GTP binding protein 2 n=1 Tax=Heterobasidion irregulare (strain TC 32-1) TaxID=747525 RepID=W4JPJ9_HETIT|nr:uncharacterized protein HETIRDRAFT_482121 [Heterobasidion irregulare TC 32-1]ETW75394.1 hypothetical protein HETIRDRAFT_482121 [Heterobasidion irregulare TC 32-1]
MFGESESESPRVPSPWDPFLSSTSPIPAAKGKSSYSLDTNSRAKLVPELEEGNIEYKLHLMHPSPARFARLVTQLKWRLLEGGGQAFYELGVADEGALVGLTPLHLAATLDTLRAMAAEINAEVVVMKEIEVLGATVREEDAREFAKKGRDKGTSAKVKTRNVFPKASPASFTSASSAVSSSLNSTVSLTPDLYYDVPAFGSDFSASPSPPTVPISTPADHDPVPSIKVDIDESLALFSMDPEPEFDETDISAFVDHQLYDPRPTDKPRDFLVDTRPFTTFEYYTNAAISAPAPVNVKPGVSWSLPVGSPLGISHGAEPYKPNSKSEKRRVARDLRRAQRKKALEDPSLDVVHACIEPSVTPSPTNATDATVIDGSEELAQALSALQMSDNADEPVHIRRIIVEAMVVRQLDLEEAFLDFTRV